MYEAMVCHQLVPRQRLLMNKTTSVMPYCKSPSACRGKRLEGLEDFQVSWWWFKYKTNVYHHLPGCGAEEDVTWVASFSILVSFQFSRSTNNSVHGYLLFMLALKFKSSPGAKTRTTDPEKELGQTKTCFLHFYHSLQLLEQHKQSCPLHDSLSCSQSWSRRFLFLGEKIRG